MRYIADSNGYLQAVSFGSEITCGDASCVEYTGGVPDDYASLEAWYIAECEKLYRWKIVSGELTLDSLAIAPTDKTAAEKLADLGGISITKLWENASPTSEFAAQTIELDLSGYDFVDIAYYGRTGPNNAIATNGYYVARLLPGKYGALTVSSLIGASTDYVEIESRTVYVTETGIRFDTGKSIYMNADSHKKYNDESETCIPYRIYGIKGVK